jgi:hypothetical protein
MKKIISVILLLFIISVTYGQETDPMIRFLFKRGYSFPDTAGVKVMPDSMKQWPDTLYYNTVYKPKYMRSPTIPISFSKVEYVPGQGYQVVPVISLGFGYTWFFGDFIFNETDKVTVEPTVYFGVVADGGLQSDFRIQQLSFNPYRYLGSIFAGGFVGFGSFSLFIGWDFVSHGPSIGIGGRVDLYTINQKFLKPIGKIITIRKHRHGNITPQITKD